MRSYGKQLIIHEPYDEKDPNASFDFGRLDSNKLISDCKISFTFKEKKEPFFKKWINKQKLLPSGNTISTDDKKDDTMKLRKKDFDAKYNVENVEEHIQKTNINKSEEIINDDISR